MLRIVKNIDKTSFELLSHVTFVAETSMRLHL